MPEMNADYLKSLSKPQALTFVVQTKNKESVSITALPWSAMSTRMAVENVLAIHKKSLEDLPNGFTIGENWYCKPTPPQLYDCCMLSVRIVDAETLKPIFSDVVDGVFDWMRLSEADATLYNAIIAALNKNDFPHEAVEQAKNALGDAPVTKGVAATTTQDQNVEE